MSILGRRLIFDGVKKFSNIKNCRGYNTFAKAKEIVTRYSFDELYHMAVIGGGITGTGCGLVCGVYTIYNNRYENSIMDEILCVSGITGMGTILGIAAGVGSPIIAPILCLCLGVTPVVIATRYVRFENRS